MQPKQRLFRERPNPTILELQLRAGRGKYRVRRPKQPGNRCHRPGGFVQDGAVVLDELCEAGH